MMVQGGGGCVGRGGVSAILGLRAKKMLVTFFLPNDIRYVGIHIHKVDMGKVA